VSAANIRVRFIDGEPPETPYAVRTSSGGRGKVARWRLRLMEQPGRWALLSGTAEHTTYSVTRYPDFEFATRTIRGRRRTYARYIGEAP
jgi:hypothetical protein